jgi:GNAT superfamily N-acetyltransferase
MPMKLAVDRTVISVSPERARTIAASERAIRGLLTRSANRLPRTVAESRIERLRPGEGDRWRCIRLQALREAPYAFGTTYAQAAQWSAARWEAQVIEFATFVAVRDGHDVGVARGAAHHRGDVRELVSMWVDPSARRRGIAAQLIDNVATWAATAGATVLVLDVVAGNAAAIALYDRAGFLRFDGEAMGELAPGEIRFVRSLATTVE